MLIKIESADNNRIKLVRKLANKKYRDEESKLVIEGVNLVSEAVRKGMKIDFILAADTYSGDFLTECIKSDSLTVCQVSESEFNKLTDAENGVGILAVIEKFDVTADGGKVTSDGNILVLDKVQDPGNIGTMIRTAVAAGYEMIIAVKGTVDVFSPKVLRATAGMIFDIPIMYISDANELERVLKGFGKKIVVTDVSSGTEYYKTNLDKGIALVIGNEGSGVSDEVMKMADIRVTIPMRGEIESLNAAISAAILMYEAIRS